jgi:hypothetical protein
MRFAQRKGDEVVVHKHVPPGYSDIVVFPVSGCQKCQLSDLIFGTDDDVTYSVSFQNTSGMCRIMDELLRVYNTTAQHILVYARSAAATSRKLPKLRTSSVDWSGMANCLI